MREIPPLRVLALRSVGPASCCPESTFGDLSPPPSPSRSEAAAGAVGGGSAKKTKTKKKGGKKTNDEEGGANGAGDGNNLTATSRLLRSFHRRPVGAGPLPPSPSSSIGISEEGQHHHCGGNNNDNAREGLESIPLYRAAYAGGGALGRVNANDVDLNHPWIASIYPSRADDGTDNEAAGSDEELDDEQRMARLRRRGRPLRKDEFLAIQGGSPAVDVLQSYIDALVELGRVDDKRLGVNFFREWRTAVAGGIDEGDGSPPPPSPSSSRRKRKRAQGEEQEGAREQPRPLGSLSLHNCASIALSTLTALVESGAGRYLGVLDLTGVHGLTDDLIEECIAGDRGGCQFVRRLSLKNCRKITGRGLSFLERLPDLAAIDVGGSFNLQPSDVIALVENHPNTVSGTFNEVYASGLGWTDASLESLMHAASTKLRGLAVGFSPRLTGPGLISALGSAGSSLERLAIHFCDRVDSATVANLGKNLPALAALDVRGCGAVNSLTGLLDARASIGVASVVSVVDIEGEAQGEDIEEAGASASLFVLARYSGITKNSLEETRRVHPHGHGGALTCVLDGGGTGHGIRR